MIYFYLGPNKTWQQINTINNWLVFEPQYRYWSDDLNILFRFRRLICINLYLNNIRVLSWVCLKNYFILRLCFAWVYWLLHARVYTSVGFGFLWLVIYINSDKIFIFIWAKLLWLFLLDEWLFVFSLQIWYLLIDC